MQRNNTGDVCTHNTAVVYTLLYAYIYSLSVTPFAHVHVGPKRRRKKKLVNIIIIMTGCAGGIRFTKRSDVRVKKK